PFASITATPVLRSEASIERTRIESVRYRAKPEEGDAGQTEDQTDVPESTLFCKRGNRRDRNRDLKHRNAARENFVLMKIGFGFRLLVFGFALDLRLFLL